MLMNLSQSSLDVLSMFTFLIEILSKFLHFELLLSFLANVSSLQKKEGGRNGIEGSLVIY